MLLQQLDTYIISILMLTFLLVDARRMVSHMSQASRSYVHVLRATMLLLFVEAFTWIVDGREGAFYYLGNWISNSALYLLNLIPLSLWLVYLDEHIVPDEAERRRKRLVYLLVNVFPVALTVMNLFTGVLFTIASGNRYTRGDGVFLNVLTNYGLFVGYIVSLFRYRKYMSGRMHWLILALGLLPIAGAALQLAFFGVTLIWNMLSLVGLAAYILIEREEYRRDMLTGLFTRTQMWSRAAFKISRRQPFSVVMIDLDRFKQINDAYGHEEGDEALRISSKLLQRSIKHLDSAYRYGGDEFVLLIESEDSNSADRVMERISEGLAKLNETSGKPYAVSFSMGVSFYDGKGDEKIDAILSAADERMYRRKREKVEARSGANG